MTWTCPCCGYAGLEQPPYERLAQPPFDIPCGPPYATCLGDPSYDVCDCCGFEFGNDDDPGTAEPDSFGTYLAKWVAAGCQWFQPTKKPLAWSLEAQLRSARLELPRS
jgi:hypothetical protein